MKESKKNKERNSNHFFSLALLILLLAASFFVLSDAPAVKKARDALLGRSQQTAEETETGNHTEEPQIKAPKGSVAACTAVYDNNYADVASLTESDLPVYDGHYYVTVNGNVPEFPDEVYKRAGLTNGGGRPAAYEYYGELDNSGRCTIAFGCLGDETMPEDNEERGDISDIRPSGWASGQGWERSHLIAWKLSGENANERNLVSGTHYFNYDAMRPVEEMTEHYIWDTGNHVLYMSRPWYSGDELIPRGVQMVAKSVEDKGKGLSFNIYCFNVVPGGAIDYNTGIITTAVQAGQGQREYVINKKSMVFHYPDCPGVSDMNPANREYTSASRTELIEKGARPCGMCKP